MATKNPLLAILSPQNLFKGVPMHNAARRPLIVDLQISKVLPISNPNRIRRHERKN